MLKVVHEGPKSNAHALAGVDASVLDAIVRDGARAMLTAALQAEVAAYIDAHAGVGFADVGAQPVSAFEVADYAIAAELIRHRLATTILPVSVADRFPDLRKIDLDPRLVWTMFIASAGPQFTNRAIDALTDTITRHVDQ